MSLAISSKISNAFSFPYTLISAFNTVFNKFLTVIIYPFYILRKIFILLSCFYFLTLPCFATYTIIDENSPEEKIKYEKALEKANSINYFDNNAHSNAEYSDEQLQDLSYDDGKVKKTDNENNYVFGFIIMSILVLISAAPIFIVAYFAKNYSKIIAWSLFAISVLIYIVLKILCQDAGIIAKGNASVPFIAMFILFAISNIFIKNTTSNNKQI